MTISWREYRQSHARLGCTLVLLSRKRGEDRECLCVFGIICLISWQMSPRRSSTSSSKECENAFDAQEMRCFLVFPSWRCYMWPVHFSQSSSSCKEAPYPSGSVASRMNARIWTDDCKRRFAWLSKKSRASSIIRYGRTHFLAL